MKGVRQADDLFVDFGAKPSKGLSSRSRRDRKWARERESELEEGTHRKAVGEGWRRGAVDTEETNRHEIGSRSSEGRPVKMSQHSSWLVEISRSMHDSVSLQMHRNVVSRNHSSCTWVIVTSGAVDQDRKKTWRKNKKESRDGWVGERTDEEEKNAHRDPASSEKRKEEKKQKKNKGKKKRKMKGQEIDLYRQTEKKKPKNKEINPTHEKTFFKKKRKRKKQKEKKRKRKKSREVGSPSHPLALKYKNKKFSSNEF